MASVGEKLKSAREKKNLAIDQVQKQTHIHSTVLGALEEGRCDEILTATYVKSFLKKYSQFLGLNPADILKEYSSLHPEEKKDAGLSIQRLDLKGTDIITRIIHVLSLVILFIAIVSLIFVIGKNVGSSFRKTKAVNARKAVTAKAARTPSAARAASTTRIARQKTTASRASVAKSTPLVVVLKVKQPVLIGVKKDGVLLFKRILPKGTEESFTADKKIEIYTARAESIELSLNGKSLGSPGRGIISNIEITRSGIRIR